MRIPSGVTDQYIYFVAVDATDFTTRETGLSGFTVYRSRNGAAAAAYTTPTVNEVDATNMPGLYELLIDEDMTIGAGNDSEEIALHITVAGMAPVTRTIELYRPKITVGTTLDVTAGAVDDVTLVATTTTNTDMRGTDSAATAANLAVVDGVVDAILVDTATTIPATIATVDANVDAILVDTGTTIPGTIATVDANVDSILADTNELQTDNVPGLIAALNDIAATDIVSAGAITTLAGAVANVDLVDTCTTNTDMRGTDSAATASALATVDSNVDSILVDTGTTIPASIAVVDGIVDNILIDTNELQTDDIPTTLAGLATAAALATVDANVDAVLVDTGTTLPATLAGLNDLSAADVNAEVDTALSDIHLDHLLAVDYDPATKPGTATALLNELVENDAGVSRFTVNSLENAPSGTGASAATIADAVWDEVLSGHVTVGTTGKALDSAGGAGASAADIADAVLDEALSGHTTAGTLGKAIADIEADATAILTDTGTTLPASIATVDANVDSVLTDTGTTIPASIAALNDIAATDIVSGGAINTTAGAVDSVTLVGTTTTNTDMRGTNSAATASALATVDANVDLILADTNELQADNVPGTLATIAGYIDTEIAALVSAVNTIDGIVDSILVDTNELQTDLADGGRVDLILDAILSDTGTDGVVLTAAERNAVADAILDRDMATGSDSGSASIRTVRQALRFSRNKVTIAGGTLTVTKEDDTTASHTATVTTAAGDPITSVDPA